MGERWMSRWTRIGMTRRIALRGIGGTMAATAGLASSRHEHVLAQDAATPVGGEVPADFRVVLHAAEVQHWPYVLSNLENLTQEWPEAHLRVVADGSSVIVLQGENSLTNRLAAVAAKGVEVFVCPNALREHQIDPTTIPSYARTELGGVVALVLSQHEGYFYVKP
jgi:intracellular sulfur oxidation DsrE/DsrF family protein